MVTVVAFADCFAMITMTTKGYRQYGQGGGAAERRQKGTICVWGGDPETDVVLQKREGAQGQLARMQAGSSGACLVACV